MRRYPTVTETDCAVYACWQARDRELAGKARKAAAKAQARDPQLRLDLRVEKGLTRAPKVVR